MNLPFNKLSIALVISTLLSACTSTKEVSIAINYLEPYCGGARPTPEMELEAQTPRPYINKEVIILTEKGKVMTLTTNELGLVKVKLPIGEHKLFEPWRYNKTTPNLQPINGYDTECLKNEWGKEFEKLSVANTGLKRTELYMIINHCEHDLPCRLVNFKPPMRE